MQADVIIQARLTSSRLPNKVLANLEGKTMLERVVGRLLFCKEVKRIILAIPNSKTNDALALFCQKNKWQFFRGPENDVLSRYLKTAQHFKINNIVRVTSDCPFIDPEIVDRVIKQFLQKKADYASNTKERTFPRGLDVEVFTFKALTKADKLAKETYQREHVTPYFFENPKKFKIAQVKTAGYLARPEIRLTVDVKEDLQLAQALYRYFGNKVFFVKDIIKFLDRHPEIKSLNKNIEQKPLMF